MKHFHLSILVLFFSLTLAAQAPATTANGYFFSTGTNYSLVNMSDAVQVIGANQENVSTITFDMGFNFNFAGTLYDRFSVGSSGVMALGNVPVSPIYYEPRNSILSPYYVFPLFAPWSDELKTGDNGGVSYKIITVNNLKRLVIEWRLRASSDEDPSNHYNKTFQVWLLEGSDRIQYVYGNSPVRDENSFIAIAKAIPDYKIVESETHAVGQRSNSLWPGAGRSYIFSPIEIIGGPIPISIEEGTITHVNCFSAANGAISLGTISGGDGNYSINWTGPAGYNATGATINDLAAGNYNFTVTDGSGAQPVTGSRTVTQPALLNATAGVTQTCAGTNNGTITISNATGGSGNYQYRVNNGNWQGESSFTSLPAGLYQVQMRDALHTNCINDLGNQTVAEYHLSATISATPSCAGSSNGSISISNAAGGSGNYRFSLNNSAWQAEALFANLAAGNYSIQMRDQATECITNLGDQSVAAYSLFADITTTPTCESSSNGSINIINAGGGSGNYQFSINNGNPQGPAGWQNSGLFNNLSAGTYFVQIRDANNTTCATSLPAQTVAAFSLQATVSSAAACQGMSNGSIYINNATGGSGNYAYSINNGNWQTATTFSALASGTYSLQMRDANNIACIKNLGGVVVAQAAAPVVSISFNAPAFCNTVILTASNTNGASYLWSNGQTTRSISLNNNSADGPYTVTVTNTSGCSASATFQYAKQNILNNYTIVGLKTITLGMNNTINGSVGNTAAGQTTSINRNTVVNGFVKSPVITLSQPVTITHGTFAAAATIPLPLMMPNTAVTSGLPNLSIPDDYNGPAITQNVNGLTIGKRAVVTITGNVFGKIIIKDGADVTFTAADISINDLETDNGIALTPSGIDYTAMNFTPNTKIRIKNTVKLGERNMVNGANSTFYLGDINTDAEKITISGKNSIIVANMYMPRGTMAININDAASTCTMIGTYIVEVLKSEKYINWSTFDCSAPPAFGQLTHIGNNYPAGTTAVVPVTPPVVETVNTPPVAMAVYPSPTTGKFSVQLDATGNSVDFVILNQQGIEIMRSTRSREVKTSEFKFDISKFPAGIYYIRAITDKGVATRQFVKIN